MAQQVFCEQQEKDSELVVSGESNLLNIPELGDIDKLRRLFSAFNAKRDLRSCSTRACAPRG